MFPYDPQLASAVQAIPQTVSDVLQTLQKIDAICIEGDGLKWFNGLYYQVTQAVETRIESGGFSDPAWLAKLDVEFATLYFSALHAYLAGGDCSGCWRALFSVRGDQRIARIQFALAGVNAHINHDLPEALVSTCTITRTVPRHGTAQYNDYTALNTTLNGLIDAAKRTLHVRLLGAALPPVSRLEDTLAAFGTSAAREQAWTNSEALWHLRDVASLAAGYLRSLDGLTTFANKALLVPVP
ncbi:MAG: DUF5995 family protein [Acidobacteriota bacterium]